MSELLTPAAAAELRHEFRTPVNHVLGYAEMLREDAANGSREAALLDGVIAAARTTLERINAALPPTGQAARDAVTTLLGHLRAPADAIVAATVELRGLLTDAQSAADVDRIAEAARRLAVGPSRPHAPTPAAASVTVTRESPVVPRAQGRILIVDDVEENRAVLARRLAREGWAVHSVASGEDALRCVAEGGFDLVLLDVLMPGLDGFAVLERIKSDPATRRIPVIMISALDDLASVVRCIEHGAEDYLTKPFDPVLLRARIGASLEKKRWQDKEADYLRQVARVIEAAAAVEHGTYAQGALGAIAQRDDELGRLARVFDSMAAGVRARESRLRDQLRELQSDVTLATSEHRTTSRGTAAADAAEFAVGTQLAGRYEILEVIGRGGMGIVYRARDRELDEDVAIKTLRRELLSDDAVLAERFRDEIRLARRISHRNVVRTHDLGEALGVTFVTMEYVRGITVRELLETRGHLGIASSLALGRQFAEALAVAHGAGVIHRDVKPENALVDAEGVLKVMDFGIARLTEVSTTRTQSGMIVGTPTYMSPEQLIGEELDARADLYALGVVLYECLTGRPPFAAPSFAALIGKVLSTPAVSPAVINPEVPPALAALVLRLLAKSPTDRPLSAGVLLELLAELG